MIGSEFGFSASDVERSHGTDFQLFFIVVVEFVGNGDGLLLDFDVFAGVNEFPIGGDGVGDGGDGLLSEREISDLAIVFGNDDVAAIDESTGTGEELLLKTDAQRRLNVGIEKVGGGGRGAGVIPSDAERTGTGLEALLIGGVVEGAVGKEGLSGSNSGSGAGTGDKRVGDGSGGVAEADDLSNERVIQKDWEDWRLSQRQYCRECRSQNRRREP